MSTGANLKNGCARDDRFERLARNPFMLAQLTERAAAGKGFADNRAMLMRGLAERLFERELDEGRQPDELTRDKRATFAAAMDALSRLAFAAQDRGEGTSLTETQAAAVPLDLGPLRRDQAIKLALDATVLEQAQINSQGKTEPGYAFYHQLVQEFFAANELLRQFCADPDLAKYCRVEWRTEKFGVAELKPDEALEPPPTTGWEETVMLAASLAGDDTPRFITAVQKENLPLAGLCLADIGADRDQVKSLAEKTRPELLTRQRNNGAHLRARIAAGLALGEMGHPELPPRQFEFEGRRVWAIAPPMQPVREGEFIRGSEPGKSKYANEFTIERRVNLPAFGIGRYPVTNAEYRFFIEDGGYKNDRWWSDAGREWKKGGPDAHKGAMEQWLRTRTILRQQKDVDQYLAQFGWRPQDIRYYKEVAQLSDEDAMQRARQQFERPFDRPAFWDDRELASPARPIVGINWFEADAYCRWLSAITSREIHLPSEMEWEKAARGADGREYPWGDKFDSALCNTVESHIWKTTRVGLYPGGVAPFGLFDASGNVWEWTSDWYQMYPGGEPSDEFGEKFRVLRGGAWCNRHGLARCAYRSWYFPDFFGNDVGFRVLSPGSISGF